MNEQLEQLRTTLESDGYGLDVEQTGDGVRVKVSAADGICGDCLVPKSLLLGMLQPALGVEQDRIELLYPDEL